MCEKPFKRGDTVFVRNDKYSTWEEVIFLTEIKGSYYPYVTVIKGHERGFKNKEGFDTSEWRYISKT